MPRHFHLWFFVPRQHHAVRVIHNSALVARLGNASLGVGTLFDNGLEALSRLHIDLLVELLHFDVVDELWNAVLDQPTLEEAVTTVQKFFVPEAPSFLLSNLDMCFTKCASRTTCDHLEVLCIATQEVTVELLENLHSFIVQVFQVKLRVVPLHSHDSFCTGCIIHYLVSALVDHLYYRAV